MQRLGNILFLNSGKVVGRLFKSCDNDLDKVETRFWQLL